MLHKYFCVGLCHAVLPVLHDEGEEVGHGWGPQLAQSVIVETGIEADDLKLDVYIHMWQLEFVYIIVIDEHLLEREYFNFPSKCPECCLFFTCLMWSGEIGSVVLQPPPSLEDRAREASGPLTKS